MATESPDPSTQNGAILAPVGVIESYGFSDHYCLKGYNHFYHGFDEQYENRARKGAEIAHAEEHVLHQAMERGLPTKDCIMYCPWAACIGCAKQIVGAKLKRLVVHRERMRVVHKAWDCQIERSLNAINYSGIEITYLVGSIPDAPDIRISGDLWSPEKLEFV